MSGEELEQQYIDRLAKECHNQEPDEDHADADDILCDFLERLGYNKIVKEYHKIQRFFS